MRGSLRLFFAIFALLLAACSSTAATPTAVLSSIEPPAFTYSPTIPPPTLTAPPTVTATPRPTASITPHPSPTNTPTPVPTYVRLRGKVTIEQAVCHYGPGAPYLYKYGVYQGSNLELLRRVEYGNYIEIQAIGGNNPCWVRVDYFDIQGNWLDLQPVSAVDVQLPPSPYYGPLSGVSAVRDGNDVTISWNPLFLRAGDSSEQTPYIVEAWVCQAGEYRFIPAGSYQTSLTISDEPGCSQPSFAFVVAAEKHGYTQRVTVPWPPPVP